MSNKHTEKDLEEIQKKLLKKVFFGSKDINIFEKRDFDKSGDETENSLASCSDGSDLDSLSDSSNSHNKSDSSNKSAGSETDSDSGSDNKVSENSKKSTDDEDERMKGNKLKSINEMSIKNVRSKKALRVQELKKQITRLEKELNKLTGVKDSQEENLISVLNSNKKTISVKKESDNIVHINKNGEPDMRYKENREKYLKPGCRKDGLPDLRLKVNRNFLKNKQSESD